jgi:hypothetical protein
MYSPIYELDDPTLLYICNLSKSLEQNNSYNHYDGYRKFRRWPAKGILVIIFVHCDT